MDLSTDLERAASEILIDAREFISDPKRWCQGFMALDEHHETVAGKRLIYAKQCCGVGAIQLAGRRRGVNAGAMQLLFAGDLLDRSAVQLYPQSEGHPLLNPTAWVNDNIGHAAILRVYDAAIAASQEVTV